MRAGSFSVPVASDHRRASLWATDGTAPNEHTRLLPEADHAIDDAVEPTPEPQDFKAWAKVVLHEFWILFRGSLPVIVAYTLQNSLQTASVLIVGRISPEALATAAFSYMFAMATGWLIALGGSTAIDTLASATFTGSKNPHDLGIILQRAVLVLTAFYIPVVVLWFFAEPVFKLLGQEDYLARDAAKFLMVLAPGGLGYIYFECMKKFLQSQGKVV
jgi:MATE family multidrug resistance protein